MSDARWASKDSYFLSVSATPFAQESDLKNDLWEITAKVIYHIPDATYIGVKNYYENDRIRESYSIKDKPAQFTELLRSYIGQNKYILVRSLSLDVVKHCCVQAGVIYKPYTSTEKGLVNLDALEKVPTGLTVIGLKGMCRMGKVVPKPYIAAVFEDSKDPLSNCVLQSLLGRMCGHGPYELPTIYVTPKFTTPDPKHGNISELDRYIRFGEHGDMSCLKASHLKKTATVSGLYLWPHPVAVAVGIADINTNDEHALANVISMAAINYIRINPFADPVQQAEILETLQRHARAVMNLHNINEDSYVDIRQKLYTSLEEKKRYDDPSWTDRSMKAYYNRTTGIVYLAGYTNTASDETIVACKAPRAEEKGTTVFYPPNDNIETDHDPVMIHDVAELEAICNMPGRHPLYIAKSLMPRAEIKDVQTKHEFKGKGGKYWNKKWRQNKNHYERVVINIPNAMNIAIAIGPGAVAIAAGANGAVAVACGAGAVAVA